MKMNYEPEIIEQDWDIITANMTSIKYNKFL